MNLSKEYSSTIDGIILDILGNIGDPRTIEVLVHIVQSTLQDIILH